MYYVALMTLFDFHLVTMEVVDAGHQMKKRFVYVFNHFRWCYFRRIARMENFIKEYGAVETKGGSLLNL
jgi:hypothetical protein